MTPLDGIDLITRQGSKFPGDLKLVIRHADGSESDVHMALAFYLVDFFTENEQARLAYESHWLQNGDAYFLRACLHAVRDGWRAAADKIRRQRKRRGIA